MTELRVGDQTIRYDRERTAAAYRAIERGEAELCGCKSCRNFTIQRSAVFPPVFFELLEQLGIDPLKEGEVYDASGGPMEDGCHLYGGWFYFVGEMVTAGERNCVADDFPNFEYFFTTAGPAAPAFDGGPRLSLEFSMHLPWVVGEDR